MARQTGMSGLSALINGFNQGYRMVGDAQSAEDDRQWRKEQRDHYRKQQADNDAIRASMVSAAAPRVAESGEVYQPTVDDEGNAMPANPTVGSGRVGEQRFASMLDAQKAADAQNTPAAVNARMSDALLRAGKPLEAQQIRTAARQEQVADLQAGQLQQAADRDKKLREVGGLIIKGGWKSVPEVYGRYDDGMSAKVEEDGKGGATVVALDAAGKEVGRTKYAALTDFFSDVAGQFDPTKWQEAKEKKAERETVERRWQADFDLRKQAEARRAAHDERMAGIAAGKAAPAAPTIELFDSKLARDTANEAVKAENKRRGDAGQPLLSGPEAARMVDDYVSSQQAQHGNRLLLTAANNELSQLSANSPEYATLYPRVLSKGDPKALQAHLESMGFKPPAAAGAPRPVPAGGPAQAERAQPQQRTAPAPAQAQAQAQAQSADPAEGIALDAARQARVQAYRNLMTFGSVKRANDPQGFEAAKAAFEQAKAAEAGAQKAWDRVAGQSSMSMAMKGR